MKRITSDICHVSHLPRHPNPILFSHQAMPSCQAIIYTRLPEENQPLFVPTCSYIFYKNVVTVFVSP